MSKLLLILLKARIIHIKNKVTGLSLSHIVPIALLKVRRFSGSDALSSAEFDDYWIR